MIFFKGKKGLGIGQAFIFIVAALTFALIMIFGYKAINDFISSGEDVEYVQFKTRMEGSFNKLYTEYGSVRIEEFHPPVRHKQVCLVDVDYKEENVQEQIYKLCLKDQIACDVWQSALDDDYGYSNIEQNVFLKPSGDHPVKVYRMKLVDEYGEKVGFLCEDIFKGRFTFVLEGKGNYVEVNKYQQEYE
jgi:hypothetical protein